MMNWYERMNMVIDYIESNLCGNIDFDRIAKIACQSAVNFQRTFSIVTDISVFEYIRRRKMTLAAFDLQNSNKKVIDIALQYGYESPEAFTRVFKDIHGVSPSNARKYGLPLKAFPRITFLLSVKGDIPMEYRIEKKEAFSVYGIEGIFTTDDDLNLKDIPMFWWECRKDGRFYKLLESTNEGSLSRVHGICDYRETGGNTFPYMLFTHRNKNCNTDGFTEVEVPAATWAIFKSEEHTVEKTSSITQNLIKRVYTDWLPTAAYKKIDGYELELYLVSDIDKFYVDTWIRVEPK
jgi:AraC family transcriptional regulator